MSRRRFKLLTIATILTLVGCSRVGTGDSQIRVLADGEALRKDAIEYAKDQDVSVNEAVRRLELQEDIGKLNAKLASRESETFGGLWIQHTPTFGVVVNMTENLDRVLQYTNGTTLANIIEARKTDKSLKQLKADQHVARKAVEAIGMQSESEINIFKNQVELYVLDEEQLSLSTKTRASVSIPDGVVLIETKSFSVSAVNAYAGHYTSSSSDTCTVGYSVSKLGKQGITTAGHCDNRRTFGSTRVGLTFQSPEYDGGSADFQWHTAPSLTIRPWARDAETDSGTPGYRYIYALGNRPEQSVGDWVCKYGNTTKHTCGYIANKDLAINSVDNSTSTYIRVSRTVNGKRVILGLGGDSGGPVYNGHKALGMVTSSYRSDSSYYGDMIYMAINYVTSRGFRVLVAPR